MRLFVTMGQMLIYNIKVGRVFNYAGQLELQLAATANDGSLYLSGKTEV